MQFKASAVPELKIRHETRNSNSDQQWKLGHDNSNAKTREKAELDANPGLILASSLVVIPAKI